MQYIVDDDEKEVQENSFDSVEGRTINFTSQNILETEKCCCECTVLFRPTSPSVQVIFVVS